MNSVLQHVFDGRGFTEERLKEIENAHHAPLEHSGELIDALYEHKLKNDRIVILPDFDMDGISAGVLGLAGFSELEFNVGIYIPDVTAGYGFHENDIDNIIAAFPDVKVIISCDTGIGERDAAAYAKSKGINIYITDHHIQKEEHTADIVVDPSSLTDTYEHKGICGAFVLYQVLEAYAKKYGNWFHREQIRRLRVFAAIGTVSDVMPVLYENRELLRDGVSIIKWFYDIKHIYEEKRYIPEVLIPGCSLYRNVFKGLMNLIVYLSNMNKIVGEGPDENLIGFYIAPMFNSCKRMGVSVRMAFDIFFNADTKALHDLWELNEKRKVLKETHLKELYLREQPWAPYVYITDAGGGLLGLLAMDIYKSTGLPVFVLNKHEENGKVYYSGSGRTPRWMRFVNLYSTTNMFRDCVSFAGGHDHAFGVTVTDMDLFRDIIDKFVHDTKEELGDDFFEVAASDVTLGSVGECDFTLDINQVSEYVAELEEYTPFGPGFEEPVVEVKFDGGDAKWELLKQGKHLKITLSNGFVMFFWNQGGKVKYKDYVDQNKKHPVFSAFGHIRSGFTGYPSFSGDLDISRIDGLFNFEYAPEDNLIEFKGSSA